MVEIKNSKYNDVLFSYKPCIFGIPKKSIVDSTCDFNVLKSKATAVSNTVFASQLNILHYSNSVTVSVLKLTKSGDFKAFSRITVFKASPTQMRSTYSEW